MSEIEDKERITNIVEQVLSSDFMKYFQILPKDIQDEYIDYAIQRVGDFLKKNSYYATSEQMDFYNNLLEHKVDLDYEYRYNISARINKTKNRQCRELLRDIEAEPFNIEFLTQADLYDFSDFDPNTSGSKYGNGLARFASIILYRERAKAILTKNAKIEKIIDQIEAGLLEKCNVLEQTFEHEQRSLEKILSERFKLDEEIKHYAKEEKIIKGLDEENQD